MKINYIIILFLTIIAFYLIRSLDDNTSYFFDDKNLQEIVLSNNNNEKETIEFNEYLIGVLACEMPASFELEALKAQAIASRTYAYYLINHNKNITTDTRTQCMLNKSQMKENWQNDFDLYYNKLLTAVTQTNNVVLKYDNEIIPAYYFSMSNGYTEDSKYVFNETKDFLKQVDSHYEENNKNFIKETIFSKENFCSLLQIDCSYININNINRSSSNRVIDLLINDKKFTGVEFRKKLNLRSTDFDIKIGDDVKITTRGYGHGVGMSQYGANYMAKEGKSYEDILKHYYQGVIISSIN